MKLCFRQGLMGLPIALLAVLVMPAWVTTEAQTPWQVAIRPSASASPLAMDRGSQALWQTLLKLHTRASLLMLTAHPDDEDGGMLAYESRGRGARVIQLTLNRGEGGQNVMSSAYWDALGVLRTEELLAADRYTGVQQYFSRVVDFGFSKTKEESLAQWGHERVLSDVVRVVRMTRPLVITSVWVGGPSDGHGQHEVAGEVAQEVFDAAGDPNIFPGQIKAGLRPWQALKMYARIPSFSISKNEMYDYATRRWGPVGVYDYIHQRWLPGMPAANVLVPEGQYNPLLGLSYFQMAAEGLGLQKSQNGGAGIPPAGEKMSPYHRFSSRVGVSANESSFFDGIDTSLMGISSLAQGKDDGFLKQALNQINSLVEQALDSFSANHPEKTAPVLAEGLAKTDALIQRVERSSLPDESKYNVVFELHAKQAQFNNAILQALGISMQATVTSAPQAKPNPFDVGPPSTFDVAVPGQEFWVRVRVVNPQAQTVSLNGISLAAPAGQHWSVRILGQVRGQLANNKPAVALFEVKVPEDAVYTRPYFTRPNIEQPYYNILDHRYLDLPFAPYPLSAWVELSYQGTPVRIAEVVQTVKRVRGEGAVLEPLMVGPAISVWVSPSAGIIPLEAATTPITVILHSNVKGPAKGLIHLDLPEGWNSAPAAADFAMTRDGQDQSVSFQIACTHLQQKRYTLRAVAEYAGRQYEEGYQTVGYPGLRPYNFYRPAVYHTTGVELKIPQGLNVGYVMGTGDRVPQSLESLGVNVHMVADLASANLSQFDAIVLGVRAYAARQDVKTYNARLLSYVKNGGVLIVQYNTPEFDDNYGPYPYSLTRNPEVVVDEESKVVILDPQNPVLTWPNRITIRDFAGWFEERGHSFMKSWDPRYQALLETHDPGQAPQKGGLLYARYCKGVYLYDAYALYRQLPQGVPGAYRLFANLVSLARNPNVYAGN